MSTKTIPLAIKDYITRCYTDCNSPLYHGFTYDMSNCFRDKAMFDKEILTIIQSNVFPPPLTFVEKFKTAAKGSYPKVSVERGKFEPQSDGSPPTLKQLGLVPKKAMSIDEMMTMLVKGKLDTNNNGNNKELTQQPTKNNAVTEGCIHITAGSDDLTVLYGPESSITVDSPFYDAVKLLGPRYNKDVQERIFHIKSVKNKIISLTKEQVKQQTLAYILRICGVNEHGHTLEVTSSFRDLPSNGACSD